MAKGVGGAQMFEVGLGWLLEQRSLKENSNIPTPGMLPQIPNNTLFIFVSYYGYVSCNLWYILVRYVPEVCGLEFSDFEC